MLYIDTYKFILLMSYDIMTRVQNNINVNNSHMIHKCLVKNKN